MAPTKMKLRVRKEKASAKSQQQQQPLRPETSPDSKCPICLDRFVNVASVERCLHRFCFRCIREWAKNKAECPLCKQPFRSIFHSVRSENEFKEFKVLEDGAVSATTSASAGVTMTTTAITVPHAGQNSAENTAPRTLRTRQPRTGSRRSQRTQDPAPSASSVDAVPLDHATLMQRDPACLRQLLPWLRRERVMGANPSELRPFLLARTDHILHELVSFARSIEAMQCPPAPSYEEDSGSPSSIINISEDEEDSETADITEDTTQDCVLPVPMATSSEISLSQSAWDDETPGPSYSTLSNPQTEDVEPEGNQLDGTSPAADQREHRVDDDRDEEEECMIVGYVKPMAERTPELVQLSSDSTEEEEQGNEAAATETVMKVESSVPSQEQAPLSPKPFPSTSHTERGENLEKSREQGAGNSHHRRREHASRHRFRKSSHSNSGSLSQTSSESSPQSGRSVKVSRSHVRLNCREPRRRGHHLLGRGPTSFPERDASSSEELVPTRSVPAQEKSFSPWDSPGHDGERKRKRRKRRRERETERSRSPHRESRHRRGNRELWQFSSSISSSSSDAESRREKPAGKRKYKTRHLERTVRRRSSRKSRERKREKERSPSVEIIFERRPPDSHLRGRRHKKRSRRKGRELNLSPTVITIDSSDSSSEHAAERQNHHAEANGRRTRLPAEVDNDHTVDYQDRDDNERVTDFSDHTIDYQERLAELSDRNADDKDRATEARNYTDDYKHHASDQNHGAAFSERVAEYKGAVAGGSTKTSGTEVCDYTTDYKHGVQKVSDQAAGQRALAPQSSRLTGAVADGTSGDSKVDSKEPSDYAADSKLHDANDRTTDYLESLLDFDESPGDSQDSDTDMRNAGVSDPLNLERCLVDVMQQIRREDDDRRMAATPLSDTRLLEELENSLMGEGHGNDTVDQREAGLVAHGDQSEAELEHHHHMTRDSRVSAEMSPDV